MDKHKRDVKGVISREKRYATLAAKEGAYAKKTASREQKKGLKEMAADSRHEEKVAKEFAKKRKGIVSKEKKKLKGCK
jgi:hypothetical protein